ncbi:MAG: SDR family NAD(P)-dependent oxidoreductase, partial [Proteobacteria bacterium]|nr:SDR family NAD(P)-dependent oxidoreductase [Pseudomonadota bacterium]
MRLFVFGLGYTALTVSRRLIAEGWMVAGTCRSPEKQEALKAEGIDASIFDTDQPLTSAGEVIGDATHILISLPPGEAGDAALRHHGDNIVRLSNLRWLGYLSTTGVYGDQAGAWVDEATPLVPSTQRGERRVAAEAGWMSLHDHGGVPVHLFRLPGIYGPGRSAIDNVRAGRTRR